MPDSIDVTATAYGAVGDGVESYGTITAAGTILTISNFTGTISLTPGINNLATLTVRNEPHGGWGFQPYDTGEMVSLTVAGSTINAPIVQWQSGGSVILNAGSVAPIIDEIGTVTCPSFTPDRQGKYLVVEGMGPASVWANNSVTYQADPTRPQSGPFITQIAQVLAPNSVQTTTRFPLIWNNQSGHILWGGNDANAIALAGIAAFNAKIRKLYFPVDGRLYLLLGCLGSSPRGRQYVSTPTANISPALNATIWIGDNVRTYTVDGSGLPIANRVTQAGSDPDRSADRAIVGRGTLRRCAHLTTINVFIPGDSQACPDPQVQAAAWMQVEKFINEFKTANPGKTINFYYLGIGGSTWASYNVARTAEVGVNGNLHFWNVPRPIKGNILTLDFIQNLNQTESGPAILPDLVVVLSNGNNDRDKIDGFAMDTMINTILAVNHADGFGPPDIIMQTDYMPGQPIDMVGFGGGAKYPTNSDSQYYSHYATGLTRTSALFGGYGLIDMTPLITKACFGWDPLHRQMRNVPAIMPTMVGPGAQAAMTIPYLCTDYTAAFSFPAAPNEAAVWAALLAVNGELSFKVSGYPGNRIRLRQGADGNLWIGVSVWGETVPTACTIDAGSTSLVVGAPKTFENQTITMRQCRFQISCASPIFDCGMAGECIIAPTNQTGMDLPATMPQRNYILGVVDAHDVTVYQSLISNRDIVAAANSTLTVGGQQFIAQDGQSQPDVVLFYPDGTIFNTRIAANGFTSLTQVTLADPAPQTLSPSVPTPMFLGRMAPRWFDTGLSLTALSSVPSSWKIEVNRNFFMLLHTASPAQFHGIVANSFLRRYGGEFYPVVYTDIAAKMQFNGIYIDHDKPFAPITSAWEMRGVYDAGESWYLGGIGGHPGGTLRSDVLDILYRTQNLCSY